MRFALIEGLKLYGNLFHFAVGHGNCFGYAEKFAANTVWNFGAVFVVQLMF